MTAENAAGESPASAEVSATPLPSHYPVTVSRAGSGAGTVASSPAGIDCGAGCAASFATGSTITLTATPDATSTFAGWTDDCAGTGPCTLTMDGARAVTATFTRDTYSLTVTRSGTGGGAVTSLPTGIDCGTTCTASWDAGTVVTLTAAPDATSTFAGWSGGGCTGTGACDVTMSAATTVSATFTRTSFSLSVTKAGAGSGSISSAPAGIDCGATCSASYLSFTTVTLTATLDPGTTLVTWAGCDSTTGPTCSVSMGGNRSVSTTFSP